MRWMRFLPCWQSCSKCCSARVCWTYDVVCKFCKDGLALVFGERTHVRRGVPPQLAHLHIPCPPPRSPSPRPSRPSPISILARATEPLHPPETSPPTTTARSTSAGETGPRNEATGKRTGFCQDEKNTSPRPTTGTAMIPALLTHGWMTRRSRQTRTDFVPSSKTRNVTDGSHVPFFTQIARVTL